MYNVRIHLRINDKSIFTELEVVLIDFLTSKGFHNKKELEINCVSKFLV